MAHFRYDPQILPDGTALMCAIDNHRRYDAVVHPNGGVEFTMPEGVRKLLLARLPSPADRSMAPLALESFKAIPGIADVVTEHATGETWTARYDNVVYVVTVRNLELMSDEYPVSVMEIGNRRLPIPVRAAVIRERAIQLRAHLARQKTPQERVRLKAPPRPRRSKAQPPVAQPQQPARKINDLTALHSYIYDEDDDA